MNARHAPGLMRIGSGLAVLLLGTSVGQMTAASPLPSPVTADGSTPVAGQPMNGMIAFMRSDAQGLWQVWVACPDLTGTRQLTNDPAARYGWPAWSPDGTRIAVNTDADDPDWSAASEGSVWDIVTMDIDGGDVKKLTGSVGLASDPAYSPDGSLIAFGWNPPGAAGIYVMDAADGSDVRRVTEVPADASWDYEPRFSPDGTRLLFGRYDEDPSSSRLFVVNLDGTGLQALVPDGMETDVADWSPDGSLIVFEAYPPDYPYGGTWVVAPDGTGLRHVTEGIAGSVDGFSDPVWSPDGSLILVMHGLHAADGSSTVGLATIRPDGTGLAYVADGKGEEHQADWGTAPGC